MYIQIAVILALLVAAAQANPVVPVESEAADAVPAAETAAESSSVSVDDSLPSASTNTVVTAESAPVAADDSLPSASTNTLVTAAALPVPVQDTPEVAAAKRDHAVQWLAAKAATDAAMESAMQEVEQLWAPYAFGRDQETLAGALGKLLVGASIEDQLDKEFLHLGRQKQRYVQFLVDFLL